MFVSVFVCVAGKRGWAIVFCVCSKGKRWVNVDRHIDSDWEKHKHEMRSRSEQRCTIHIWREKIRTDIQSLTKKGVLMADLRRFM